MPQTEQLPVDREQFICAIGGLLRNTIEPMFGCLALEGLLMDAMKEKSCSREAAALAWMEDNFDSLYAALYAISAFVEVLEP